MDVTITIDDAAVRNMLNRAPTRINWAMRAAINDSVNLLLGDMKVYPPEIPDSTYVRRVAAGLQGSWSKQVTGTGINVQGRVGSNAERAPYNRYVMDATMQARIHQGRWQTVQSVRDQRAATVQGFFETRLREAINQL